MRTVARWAAGTLAALALGAAPGVALEVVETPMFKEAVAAGEMAPVAERVPEEPRIVAFDDGATAAGRHGGDLRMLVGRAKDVRLLVVYGYARLVGYSPDYEIRPDILAAVEVEEGRAFTLKLRKGHRWSDGHPFTAEDFRYWWEDVANNPVLKPSGPPKDMLIDGAAPTFEVIDESTVRYTWPTPNRFFLAALARAAPLFIYRPAHYMKRFHLEYASAEDLAEMAAQGGERNWAAMHNRMDNMYRFDNPDLPTLQPWMNTTFLPSTRFIGARNPYYYRVDEAGRQLPYIDRVVLTVADGKLIPAKAGAGESDLQSRSIYFNNFTFLKANEERNEYVTYLWRTAKGAHLALYPNLNINDPVWREVFRDSRFRRALSLAIDRNLVNQTLYYGLAIEGNNTVLPASPLFLPEYQTAWTEYDIETANRFLDEMGLTERNGAGTRLLPDGRAMDIIVETAGEETEQTDVLELVRDGWAEIGIRLFSKPSQREVFRNRIFAGETQISIWGGFENGVPTPDMSPAELAPTTQQSLQWPKWGQYFETSGGAGEPPDMPAALELARLNEAWLAAGSRDEREAVWRKMLQIHADEMFTIGIVSGVMQPIVVSKRLRNVPQEGVYNWEPGAQFGIYRPDTFWFGEPK